MHKDVIVTYKDIHIGRLIKKMVFETEIQISRICNFMKYSENEILLMYEAEELPTGVLLKWSKLLKYDFFRIYSQHLIIYSPHKNTESRNKSSDKESQLPSFRKNVYTQEIIDFILELLKSKVKTKNEIIQDYNIPKTTLYKWISKNRTENSDENHYS